MIGILLGLFIVSGVGVFFAWIVALLIFDESRDSDNWNDWN